MNGNKPNLTLSMDDKIYLAVSKRDTDKLCFVYTLACMRDTKGSNTYNMMPTREVHTFRNKESGKLYHDTIEQIVNINANDERYHVFFDLNDKAIEQFLTYTK